MAPTFVGACAASSCDTEISRTAVQSPPYSANANASSNSAIVEYAAEDRRRAGGGYARRADHRNSLYLAESQDRRWEERHAPEEVSDHFRAARERLGRMLAKSMATDQLEPSRRPRESADARSPLATTTPDSESISASEVKLPA